MITYIADAKPSLLKGTALLRLDFNTEDDWRMRAVLPTIKLLLTVSDKVIIISHRGRPEPLQPPAYKTVAANKKFSLRKNATTLSRWLRRNVVFIDNFNFEGIRSTVQKSKPGSIFLLENLRFAAGEEKNDPAFAKLLASLADFYVNDAFAVSHRANASVAAITKFLPAYAGLELQNEIASLSRAMKNPKRPLTLILGGAKAADKLGVIKFFKNKADWFLLGGGPANTILSFRGMDVKKSVRDIDPKDASILGSFSRSPKVVVPSDFKWHGSSIWDIGPKSVKIFSEKIAKSKTILWSGPLGLIENPAYARGSVLVAKAVAKNRKAFSITGGGETVMFLKQYRLDKKFSFVSTGGGAMMDFLAGERLPGIEALDDH